MSTIVATYLFVISLFALAFAVAGEVKHRRRPTPKKTKTVWYYGY